MSNISTVLEKLTDPKKSDRKCGNCGSKRIAQRDTKIGFTYTCNDCGKKTSFFDGVNEGACKRAAESSIEKICTCDGGMSLDPADHDKDCPAYKKLQDGDYGSDDIDAAEARFGRDR